jgi:opacity protein-like surface antigen
MIMSQFAKRKNCIVAVPIAVVLSAAMANVVEAKPWKHKHHHGYQGYEQGEAWWKHKHNKRHRVKKKYYVGERYHSLPSGCRRVVIRERTYYTYDNQAYFVFSPFRNVYVVVDPWR